MPWQARNEKRYFYVSVRGPDRNPRKYYVGSGPEADMVARAIDGRRNARNLARMKAAEAAEAYAAAVRLPQALGDAFARLATIQMTALGFHRHDRGRWRKKRMATTTTPTPTPDPPPMPIELQDVLRRAEDGDLDAIPELVRALREYPQLAARFGDLGRLAREKLVRSFAGESHLWTHAAEENAATRRAALLAECESGVERMLAERMALCEFEAEVASIQAATFARQDPASPAAAAATKRLDQAHARLLSAARALADVRRVLRQGLSPLDLVRGTREGPARVNRVATRLPATAFGGIPAGDG